LEDEIDADNNIDFIGPYNLININPKDYKNFKKNVRPSVIEGMVSTIINRKTN
jgi:hypothetical protein